MAGPRKLLDKKFYGPRRKLQQAEQVRVQVAGKAGSGPGSGQMQVQVQAAGRAGSSPATGRFAETRRRQCGPVHSVSSTRASYSTK